MSGFIRVELLNKILDSIDQHKGVRIENKSENE
jgi:hypothetical protein